MIEISNKKTPEESDGIKVTREIESVTDMNIGLIPRKTFGFSINKYITKIEEEVRALTGYKFDECNNDGMISWYEGRRI